jgi:nitrite reductase/ring-hydroxylating ferredoxin subunit
MKVVVGKVSDFANGERKIIDLNGKSIGVFRIDDQFYAIRNRCPHQWGPLCLGDFAPRAVSSGPGDVHLDSSPPLIACPWHGWEYDLATGQSFMGPGRGNMAALSYDVSVLPGGELAGELDSSARGSTASGARPRAGGRIPGPYVAETMPVSVEQEYVVVDDSPVRRESQAAGDSPAHGETRGSRGNAAKEARA